MSDLPRIPNTHERPARSRARALIVAATAYLVVTALVTQLLSGSLQDTIVPALVIGVLLVGGFYLFRAISRALGWLTAIAAMSLIGATIMGAFAAIASTCPAALEPGRCSTQEIGTWVMVGAMMPAGYILAIGVPVALVGAALAAGRMAWAPARDKVRAARAARAARSK